MAPSQIPELTATDAAYLIKCLQNGTTSIVIDLHAIAAQMNTKPHNVTNRLSSLRKRYGLNIVSSASVTSPKKPNAKKNGKESSTTATEDLEVKTQAVITGQATKRKLEPTRVKTEDEGIKHKRIKMEGSDEESQLDSIAYCKDRDADDEERGED